MSKTLGLVAAAAMLASVTAFAQTPSSSPASTDAATAASSDSAPADARMPKMRHRHRGMTSMNKADTDHDADKLNACMSNATPTSQQEACLKQASSS